VHGGQQPVSGAAISLYAAGFAGKGAGATDLLAGVHVTTDSGGNFVITGDYTCPSATTQVYLVARGGNPGLAAGTNNSALVMMAALGNCGSLTPATTIFVDEVTTVAAAWSLAQFFGSNAQAGASPSNATGLSNAFLIAANLADNATGKAPGASLPQGASLESRKLYTLANAIAPCINSDGTTGCAALFAAAALNGTEPTNTFDALLNVVRNPAQNVTRVFNASAATGPFQPSLPSAPNDWTMSITYGNCMSGCGGLDTPTAIALDSAGNVWAANYFGGVVSKLSPAGNPFSQDGFAGSGLNQSYGLTIDPFDNAWVTNEQSVAGANNHYYGSVSRFSSAGLELSGYGYTGGGLYYPVAAAADSNGTVWVADHSDSSATLLAADGSGLSGSGYASSQLPFTTAVALDASHNAWFAAQGIVSRITVAGAVTSYPCCSSDPAGIAVDPSGNIWVADYGASDIVEVSATGTVLNRTSTAAGATAPLGLAIDGSGNVWTSNYYGNSVTELLGGTAQLSSPVAGLALDAMLDEPYGIAIDASGNLWLSNSGDITLTEIIGLASPVKMPLVGPPSKP
jgi:streptogramin lyase